MSAIGGKTALVTGASSGLGWEFAKQLAGDHRCNLILVARREERLEQLKDEIVKAHGVQVDVIPMDLMDESAPQALYDRVKQLGLAVDVLVNNAGLGLYGEFLELAWERQRAMIQIDIITLTHLTHLFLRDMIDRDFGYILNVSSVGGFQSSPTYAAYSACKAFVLSLSEAINYEIRETRNVTVSTICPGMTATEFHAVSGQKLTFFQRAVIMDSGSVARIGIKRLLRKKPLTIPGFLNAFMMWSLRFVPRRLAIAMAYETMKN